MLCCFELTGSGQELYTQHSETMCIYPKSLTLKRFPVIRGLFVMTKNNGFLSVWLAADRESNQFEKGKHLNKTETLKKKKKTCGCVNLLPLVLPYDTAINLMFFLKDHSLFINTWTLTVGTQPRQGEKQTWQVSAFLQMKNKRGESWEGGIDVETQICEVEGGCLDSDSSLWAHQLREEPVLLPFDTTTAGLPLK